MKQNPCNRCSFKGIITSDILPAERNDSALEFVIKIPRPKEIGKEQYYDFLRCYACDYQSVQLVKNTLAKGMAVEVEGEVRIWFDKTWRILVRELKPVF